MSPCTQHWLHEPLQKANSNSGRQQGQLLLLQLNLGGLFFPRRTPEVQLAPLVWQAGCPGTRGHPRQQRSLSSLVQPSLPGKPKRASSSARRNSPALHEAWHRREGNGSALLATRCQLFPLPLYGNIPWPRREYDAVGGRKGKATPELSAHEDRMFLF